MSRAASVVARLATRFLRVEEVWFGEPPAAAADITRHFQSPSPIAGVENIERKTLVLDLSKSEEELFSTMDQRTRYKIRRAERDGCYMAVVAPDPDVLARLENYFRLLQSRKTAVGLNRRRVVSLHGRGRATLTCCRDADGEDLSWHVYILGAGRARLLYSVSRLSGQTSSADRQAIGRANRLHHWLDIVYFREQRLSVYDFGGWYAGSTDSQKLSVNAFKEDFGGVLETNFDCSVAHTPVGSAALRLQSWLFPMNNEF